MRRTISNDKTASPASERTALLALLQDENDQVASLAMEQLLGLGDGAAQGTIAEYQDAPSPLLRNRIHQIGSILQRRREERLLIAGFKESTISIWDGACHLNLCHDRRHYSQEAVDQDLNKLADGARDRGIHTPAKLAAYLRDQRFAVADRNDMFDLRLYLVQSLLRDRVAGEILMCALAQELGRRLFQWQAVLVVVQGAFCLLDSSQSGQRLLIEPADQWKVSRLADKDAVHACTRRDAFLALLSQMFVAATVEGSLRDLHQAASHLSALRNAELALLPYPVGEAR